MPETYPPEQYIEPPPATLVPSSPSDVWGLAPRAPIAPAPAAPAPKPPDEVIQPPLNPNMPGVQQIAMPAVRPGADWQDVDPAIKERVESALDEMPENLRGQIKIVSGHRSHEQQAAAHQRYQTGQGGLAAQPGHSLHEQMPARAFDYQAQTPEADRAFRDAVGKRGIEFPYGAKGDPNHGQLAGGPKATNPDGLTSLYGWATGMSPALQERAHALENDAHRLQEQYHSDVQSLLASANQAPAGSRERDDEIAKLREREHRYLAEYEAIASRPPVMKPVDALENFGSAATIVAMLGGLFARRHLTAALGAAGTAMQAINQNNYDQFQRSYKQWEQQSTTALNMVKLHAEEIRSLIDDKKLAVDEKNARLRLMFEGLGMNRAADQMALGASEKVLTEFAGMERATAQMQASANGFKQARYWQLRAEGHPDQEAAELSGMGPSHGAAAKPVNIEAKGEDGKTVYSGAATFDPITKKYTPVGADHPLPDNTTVSVRSTSQPRSAPAMFMQKYQEEHPNATSQELAVAASEYRRWQAIEGAFGGGILGRNLIALNTVADHLLLIKEYSEALRNKQIPRANGIANRIATELGKPEVTNFAAGRDIMADEVVRLLTSTGGTEADRQGMQSRLAAAASPEQLAGAINVFERFVGGRFEALEQQYAGNDASRRKHFESEMLTDKARQVFAKTQPAPSADGAGAEQTNPMRPATAADVDAIAPGKFYIDPRDPEHIRQK